MRTNSSDLHCSKKSGLTPSSPGARYQLTIDLIGWSRGAVIAATIARNLDYPGITFAGNRFSNVNVRFVGLFDAVSQMLNEITPYGWATAFSENVLASYHLIHTNPIDDGVFPTEMGFSPLIPYYRDGANQQELSRHTHVGRDGRSLAMMIVAARAANVTI